MDVDCSCLMKYYWFFFKENTSNTLKTTEVNFFSDKIALLNGTIDENNNCESPMTPH